jgi:hypothetical protein
MKRELCIAVLLGALCGCEKTDTPPPKGEAKAPPAKSAAAKLDEKAVIEIAKKAVAEKDPAWADRATYEAKRDKDTPGGWWVTVWRIAGHDKEGKPLFTPGGHRGVRIDETGKVTAYMLGE